MKEHGCFYYFKSTGRDCTKGMKRAMGVKISISLFQRWVERPFNGGRTNASFAEGGKAVNASISKRLKNVGEDIVL